jgi:hypothetical protein
MLVAMVCFTTAPAWAVELAPGQGRQITPKDGPLTLPSGPRLAQQSVPFDLNFAQPGDEGGLSDLQGTGTLTSSVYRDPDTGGLVFVYDVDTDDASFSGAEPGGEFSRLIVGGFTGFRTDVTGNASSGGDPLANLARSADGDTVRADYGEGIGGPPLLIIATDATAFDAGGLASFTARDEFLVTPDNDVVLRETTVNLTGIYRPIVPEPSAAWAALAGAAVLLRWRRR